MGLPGVFERIAERQDAVCDVDVCAHRARDVVLVVEPVGGEADGAAWGDFLYEHNSAAWLAVDEPPHVVAQINFCESRVAGNGQAEQARAVEAEADDADVGLTIVKIRFGAGRDERCQQLSRHAEVEHEQLGPAGCQHGAFASHVWISGAQWGVG